jgi:hypothetical protein
MSNLYREPSIDASYQDSVNLAFIGWSSTKFSFFVQYGIQDGGYGMTWFNIGPYGKNVQMWNQTVHDCSLDGPLQSLAFLFNMEFKMAATAWLGLTSDPIDLY